MSSHKLQVQGHSYHSHTTSQILTVAKHGRCHQNKLLRLTVCISQFKTNTPSQSDQSFTAVCQLVSALSRSTGGYSTVPLKSVSSAVSFKPIACPPRSILISAPEHPPKVTIAKTTGEAMAAPGIPALPPEMLPHMNWQAEDKLASWDILPAEAHTVLYQRSHSQRRQGHTHPILWWPGGYLEMGNLEGTTG